MRVTGCLMGVVLALAGVACAAPVRVSLRTELDSRSAQAGERVTATLEKPVSVDGLNLPKGTVVLGHVQQVTKKDAQGRAGISVVFDHVSLMGKVVPVTATIVAVMPSRYQVIPEANCDRSALRGLSDEQGVTTFCQSVPRYGVESGVVMKRATARGPLREASLTGPLMLAKGTLMDVEIVAARD